MKSRYLSILAVTMIVAIIAVMSGCTSSSSTSNPTTAPTTSSGSTVAPATGASDKITVVDTASKVTVTGGNGEKVTSDAFALSKDGWYIITTTYNGPTMSDFIANVITQKGIDEDAQTVEGLLPMMLNPDKATLIITKGTYDSGDYKVYVQKAQGPWTVEIQKSPVPQPSGLTSFSHKASDSTTSVSPFFALKQGTVTFTVTQHIDTSKFEMPIEVKLVNADTGELATYVVHNGDDETQTATYDVPADGNYIMEVTCGGDWEISFTE
jgi:hypothetical protein